MDIIDCKELFSGTRPEEWKEIPDIDLYMDQIIGYMKRQHIGFSVNENLTPAMVNNYVKQKVMPKASGKKYNKTHIAYLTAICLLKQVVSVGEVGVLLDAELNNESIETFYEKYLTVLDEKLSQVDDMIKNTMTKEEVSDLVLELAISSYAQKLACECLLSTINEDDGKKKK